MESKEYSPFNEVNEVLVDSIVKLNQIASKLTVKRDVGWSVKRGKEQKYDALEKLIDDLNSFHDAWWDIH